MNYKFYNKKSFVLVKAIGTQTTADEASRYAKEMMDYCTSVKCNKVLLDEREMEMAMSISDDYELAESISEKFVGVFSHMACVPSLENRHPAADFELFAQNRGINYKWFGTVEDAQKWLEA